MIEVMIILLGFVSLGFCTYRYVTELYSKLQAQYDVIYYMLSDMQRVQLNKTKNK